MESALMESGVHESGVKMARNDVEGSFVTHSLNSNQISNTTNQLQRCYNSMTEFHG